MPKDFDDADIVSVLTPQGWVRIVRGSLERHPDGVLLTTPNGARHWLAPVAYLGCRTDEDNRHAGEFADIALRGVPLSEPARLPTAQVNVPLSPPR